MKRCATVSHFFLLLVLCNLVHVASQPWIDCDGDGVKECNPNPERATCDTQTGVCSCIFGWTFAPRCAEPYDPCTDNTTQICPDSSVCVKYDVPTVYKCACWQGYTTVFNESDPIPGTDNEKRLIRCDGECAKNPNLCPANSVCVDAKYPAGYKCECNEGLTPELDLTKPIPGTDDSEFRVKGCSDARKQQRSGAWKQQHSSILGMIAGTVLSVIMLL
mmetsp:Transcript_8120/g.12438  ORF Transcript_8120/g.12438 Transcript_8120/m.12438 type:complete len:218 (+) Transcript_8120:67-720(+)